MALKLLIADDHGMLRDALKEFLMDLESDVEIFEAETYEETTAQAAQHADLDLLILDLNMPGMEGVTSIKALAQQTAAPLLMMSAQFGRDDVLSAIDAGARGYIPKTLSCDAMVSALRLVLSGEIYLPSVIHAPPPAPVVSPEDAGKLRGGALSELTPRELEILGHLIAGLANKEIARVLAVESNTVKVHLHNCYKKIGAANRADAVRIAIQIGWAANG